ncbi:MAG: TetR/AcrR family transcriptional regulator [Prevotella sp.]|nr:TetR/AcrR family transcriptional regulator [Prevotella sp.]
MQIKKEYTREQIVTVGKRVFLRKGFAKTSMRDIAKGCGIGVSNIYNYFNSKDELFRHIVTPLTTELERMMHDHHNVRDHEQFMKYARGENNELMMDHVQEYLSMINNHRDELKLILYQAQGSTLENYIDVYTDECTKEVLRFMKAFKRSYPDFRVNLSPFTYHIHMVWMFNFISEVIKHDLKPQEMKKAIEDYIQFEFSGWRAIMNPNNI